MKKILAIALMLAAAPAFAACDITGGACSPSSLYRPTLNERYSPNNLELMQKPNAFQHEYQQPFNQNNVNMNSAAGEGAVQTENYNANCQFGFCPTGAPE
jgi:hypothetical protein